MTARRPLKVTEHAVLRYQQRVADVSDAEATAALSTNAFAAAAHFGAQVVRKPGAFRAIIEFTPVGATVLTVLRDGSALPVQLTPREWGLVPWLRDQMAGWKT
jgi:hypothetical protein